VARIARKSPASLVLLLLAVAAGALAIAILPVLASGSPSLRGKLPSPRGEPSSSPSSSLRAMVAVAPGTAANTAQRSLAHPATGEVNPKRPRVKPFLTARVWGGSVRLYARPGRSVVAALGTRTEFGSPRTLAVVDRRGRWLAVVAPEIGNGRVAWVDARSSGLQLGRTRLSVSIDLSRRVLIVKRGDRAIRRMTVGVGRSESPTPLGRFAVTDKLPGDRYGSYYGCCILALSAKQPNLPPGWRGGDRIAIHGTDDPASIGAATSAGCPHASDRDLRYLMRALPLGTPVFVHP
jgi:lipoprotein-anchoring transpeptidase ErfK/SrfK